MTKEHLRKRWRWMALTLPAATLIAFGIAGRFHWDRIFIQFSSQVLPASLAGFAAFSPFVGWGLLTIGCAGWLCFDFWRSEGRTGKLLWASVISGTPLFAFAHALVSAAVAWPGCVLIFSN